MTLSQREKCSHVLIILVAGVLLLVIIQPWNLYFLNDDFEHIPQSGKWLLVSKHFLRPVSNLLLFCGKLLFGKSPAAYFVTTWILHLVCTVTGYFFSAEVLKKYAPSLSVYLALLAALFFLFYPFHAEPLFWIIGRGSIIATLFTLGSLYFYLRKNERLVYLLISIILFMIALLSYESIWNVLLFYLIISYLNIKHKVSKGKNEVIHAVFFLFTFIAYLVARHICLDSLTGGYNEIDNHLFQIPLLLTNLVKLTGRNFTPPFCNTTFSVVFFSVSVITFLVIIAIAYKKNKAVFRLMILLWLGVVSSVITATPLGIDTHGNESERFIYFSSFFFCFFVAVACSLVKKRILRNSIAGFLIMCCIAALISYNANYRYASLVAKSTLQFIQHYPDFKNAYFIDVPAEYKGALIFRSGLPEAVKWIASNCKYHSVIIVNQTENTIAKIPFQTGETTWEKLRKEKRFDTGLNKYFLKDSLNRNITLNENDIVFWFTDNGLYKVNRP